MTENTEGLALLTDGEISDNIVMWNEDDETLTIDHKLLIKAQAIKQQAATLVSERGIYNRQLGELIRLKDSEKDATVKDERDWWTQLAHDYRDLDFGSFEDKYRVVITTNSNDLISALEARLKDSDATG